MTDLNVHLFLQTFNAIKLFFLVVEYLIVMYGQPSLIFAGRPHTYTLKRLTPMSVFLTPLANNWLGLKYLQDTNTLACKSSKEKKVYDIDTNSSVWHSA